MNRANTNSSHVNKSSNGGHATPQALLASSILVVTQSTPRHVCANTIRKLLDQLIEIHDQNQKSQRKGWDAFVKQRGKVIKANVTTSVGGAKAHTAGVPGLAGAAAIIRLGLSNEDEDELSHTEGLIGFAQLGTSSERREFDRLIRSGIPLVYRSKVWLECSAGLEMKEPGVFQDLLNSNDGGEADKGVVGEIEKDAGRTMTLNLFFG